MTTHAEEGSWESKAARHSVTYRSQKKGVGFLTQEQSHLNPPKPTTLLIYLEAQPQSYL